MFELGQLFIKTLADALFLQFLIQDEFLLHGGAAVVFFKLAFERSGRFGRVFDVKLELRCDGFALVGQFAPALTDALMTSSICTSAAARSWSWAARVG